MPVFKGEHEQALDDKGRVVLPLALRKCIPEPGRDAMLEKPFTLTPGDGNECLQLYPAEDFDRYLNTIRARYAEDDKLGQNYLRRLTSAAVPIELDRQFRFILPERQRNQAGIQRDICFVGADEKIEIWAKDRWEKWQSEFWQMSMPPRTRSP